MPEPTKTAVGAELHHQRRVRRRGDAAGREVGHRQLLVLGDPRDQLVRHAQLDGLALQQRALEALQRADARHQRAHVAHGLDDVAGAGFALGADHGGAFGYATERFTQVTTATDERNLELVLVDVIVLVSRRQNLALINVINAERFQNLGFDNVTNARLCHHRDGHSADNLLDHARVAHARDAAIFADVCRHPFQRHDSAGARFFGNARLFGSDDIHDHATLEHLRQPRLDGEGASISPLNFSVVSVVAAHSSLLFR